MVDRYLEFVAGRCRPNTLRAVAFDLKAFLGVTGRDPVEVTATDVFGRGRLFHRRQWWPHYVRDDGRSRLCPARTSSGTAPVMRDPVTRHVACPAMLARGWRRGAAASALLRL